MLEGLKKFLPEYIVDKLANIPEEEFNSFSEETRKILIHGTDEEVRQAQADINAARKDQGEPRLRKATREFIADMRETAKQGRK